MRFFYHEKYVHHGKKKHGTFWENTAVFGSSQKITQLLVPVVGLQRWPGKLVSLEGSFLPRRWWTTFPFRTTDFFGKAQTQANQIHMSYGCFLKTVGFPISHPKMIIFSREHMDGYLKMVGFPNNQRVFLLNMMIILGCEMGKPTNEGNTHMFPSLLELFHWMFHGNLSGSVFFAVMPFWHDSSLKNSMLRCLK